MALRGIGSELFITGYTLVYDTLVYEDYHCEQKSYQDRVFDPYDCANVA